MPRDEYQGILGFPKDFYDKLIYDKSTFLSGAEKLLASDTTDDELIKTGLTVGDQGRYGASFKSKGRATALEELELSTKVDWMDYLYIIPDAIKLRTRRKNRPKLTQFQIQSGSEFFAACKDYNILKKIMDFVDTGDYQQATTGGTTWDDENAKPDTDIINAISQLVKTTVPIPDIKNIRIFYPAELFGIFQKRNMFENIVTNLKRYLTGSFELGVEAFMPYRPPRRHDGTNMVTELGVEMNALGTSAIVVAGGEMLGTHYTFNPAEAARARVPLSETGRIYNFGDQYVQWQGYGTIINPDIRIATPLATSPSHRVYEITGVIT